MSSPHGMSAILLGVILALHSHAGGAAPADSLVTIGSQVQPFFDDWLIAEMHGASLRLHSPEKREVVFRFDAPWEGGQSAYVTVLRDGNPGAPGFRMYYRGGGDLGRECTCLAESADGIHWTRPSLGLFECNGSKANNIIWTGKEKAYCESHNFSPFIDQNPACRPDERYKAITLSRGPKRDGERKNFLVAFASADGVHWRRLQEQPVFTEGAFDSHNTAFWDTVRKQYVCYFRVPQQDKKSVGRTTSADFLHWTAPELLDFGPAPPEHLYTNGILPYPGAPQVYVGLPMRFMHPRDRNTIGLEQRKTDGFSDAVFMSSHDGLHWHRFLEAFIRPGLDPQNWGGAHGNSTPAWGILETADGPASLGSAVASELSIYWAEHYDNYPEKKIIPQLRRGTLRPEGFVSVNAPYVGGEFVTRTVVFSGKRLVINYSTSAAGSLRVEMQDAQGRALPGLDLASCREIWGDELQRVVAWRGGNDISGFAGQPVRIRFVLKDADLFSMRFQ